MYNPFMGTRPSWLTGTEKPADMGGPDLPPVDEDAVPVGTTKEILTWVDGDHERAQQALDAETAKGESALKGLVKELKKLLEQAE